MSCHTTFAILYIGPAIGKILTMLYTENPRRTWIRVRSDSAFPAAAASESAFTKLSLTHPFSTRKHSNILIADSFACLGVFAILIVQD